MVLHLYSITKRADCTAAWKSELQPSSHEGVKTIYTKL